MEAGEAVAARRSVRGFLPLAVDPRDPVNRLRTERAAPGEWPGVPG